MIRVSTNNIYARSQRMKKEVVKRNLTKAQWTQYERGRFGILRVAPALKT